MSQMTQQQSKESSEYIKIQIKQYDDFDLICCILLLIEKGNKSQKEKQRTQRYDQKNR
jgi:hypothetical protein